MREEIEERITAEEALIENETLQRILLDSLPVGVVIVDPETRLIERVNDHAVELFGAPADQLLNKICHLLLCPACEGECPVCDLGLDVTMTEREMLKHDGSSLPVLKTVKKVQIRGREKLLECFVDISQRKRAEEALKEWGERFSSISEQSLVGVYIIDAPNFQYVNPKFADIFGYTVEEILDEVSLKQLVYPDDLHIVREKVAARRKDPSHKSNYTFRGVKKDGKGHRPGDFRIFSSYTGPVHGPRA